MTANRPDLADAAERHGGHVDDTPDGARWWITDPSSAAEDTASHLGLVETRRLHQMRRPLPLEDSLVPTPTRAFDPEHDADAWLTINNAAFAWHPDQGGWTRDTLDARLAEPWFEPDGFRVTDIDGALAGFCWTKVHPAGSRDDATEALGEIYVIAIAPARAGTGLGTGLTVAGLDWLWEHHHTPTGMLYVEADNAPALATYRRLGFQVHSTDVAFATPADAS